MLNANANAAERSHSWSRVSRIAGRCALLPLALFALFHAWEQWPLLHSRAAWLDRVQAHALTLSLAIGVLVLVLASALWSLTRVLRSLRSESNELDARGRQSFQLITFALFALFLIYHLAQVWPPPNALTSTWVDSYQRLWQRLGQPLPLTVYVVGCAALAFHLANGVSLALESSVPSRLRKLLRYGLAGVGTVLFVLYLQLVGRFALGEPVIPIATQASAAASSSE
jgi:succinate dehydrogenase hydrophobic anchor subunit